MTPPNLDACAAWGKLWHVKDDQALKSVALRASSANRIALCPGSARASWGIASMDSPASLRGTRIHAWLAWQASGEYDTEPVLLPDEKADAEAMWAVASPIMGDRTVSIERRLSRLGWSGQPDLVVLGVDPVVVDYKSGWGEVDQAPDNAQMRVYAVLAAIDYYCAHIEAVIVTPRGLHSRVEYKAEDLLAAHAEICAVRDAALRPNAPRIPSPDACKWCPAFGKTSCPETCQAIERAGTTMPAVSLESLLPEQIGAAAQAWVIIRKRGEQLEDEVRRRLEAGEDIPGAKLKASGVTASIPDAQAAYNLVPDIPQEIFVGACTLSLNKLAEGVHSKITHDGEQKSKAEVKQWLRDKLASVIEEKPKRGALVIGGSD